MALMIIKVPGLIMAAKCEKAGDDMKKTLKTAAGILVVALVTVIGVAGAFTDVLSVTNKISMGDVNIAVSEYARKGKGEVKYQEPATILPGETISKIPRITNKALPCWIRARITYTGATENLEGLKEELISGISKDWVKRGEYYYYTKVLKKQESTDLFQSIMIPASWTEEHEAQKLTLDIQTDAIQAANFKPDFDAMSPWGNQKILKCIHEENGTMTCKKGEKKLSVEFNGNAHKLIAVPDDFFTNLETAMPGDALHDTVAISNTTENDAEIFFRISAKGRSAQKLKMLKGIRFQIAAGSKTLYKGTLDAAKLNKNQSLGIFKPGQKEQLEFSLEIPKEWGNSYALQKTDVTWIFSVNENARDANGYSNVGGSGGSGGNRAGAVSRDTGSKKVSGVKTGDPSMPGLMLAVLVLSGAIAVFVKRCKGGKKS